MASATATQGASVIAAAIAGAPDPHLQGSLRHLRDSLRGFHDDLEVLFAARRRHSTVRRRLQLRLQGGTGGGQAPAARKVEFQADALGAVAGSIEHHDLKEAQPKPEAQGDLWSAVAGDIQRHSLKEVLASEHKKEEKAQADPAVARRVSQNILFNASHRSLLIGKEAEEAEEPEAAEEERQTVGITGVGRLAGDSPDAKGSRRELGMEKLGGEQVVRELLVEYIEREVRDRAPELTKESIQDLWVDRLMGDKARVSALYVYGVGRPETKTSNIDCRQFLLSKDVLGRWRVDCMLEPEAAAGERPDECEVSQSVEFPSPLGREARRGLFPEEEAKAGLPPARPEAPAREEQAKEGLASGNVGGPSSSSVENLLGEKAEARLTPKRKAPPPLTELPPEEPAAAGDATGDTESPAAEVPDSLAEAIRFGLGVAEGSRTPRQVFQSFATQGSGGTTPVIHLQKFASLVSMYGGRSPAVQGGEGISSELFDELAVSSGGDDRGVPYDLFCSELCPEKAPDAVLRVKGKRVALLRDLRAAVVSQFGSSPSHASMQQRMSSLLDLVQRSPRHSSEGTGSGLLTDSDFERAVCRILGSPPAPAPDAVAVKALWCDLVRGKKGGNRRLNPEDLCKVFLEAEGGGMTPLGANTFTRLSPAGRTNAKPLDESVLAASEGSGDVATALGVKPKAGTLLEALRFGVAADGRAPREIFAAAATDGPELRPLSREEFVALAAKLGGGIPVKEAEDPGDASTSSTDAEAGDLFQELALPGAGPGGRCPGVPYELFAAELCPERAPEDAAKVAKLRTELFRELQSAVRSGTVSTQARAPPALAGAEPLDEASFTKAVTELIAEASMPAPEPIAVKALWHQLVRGRRSLQRLLAPKELMALINSTATSPSAGTGRLHHLGSLEFSDDENSELELSLSQSVPGPDAVIDDVTPFATPTAARPILKSSIDNSVSLVPMKESEGVEQSEEAADLSPKPEGSKAEPGEVPLIQVVPPVESGPPAGLLADALLKAAAQKVVEEKTTVPDSLPPSPLPASPPKAHAKEAGEEASSDDQLRVTIVSARGLRDADWLPGSGVSDPYCTCEIKGKPKSKFQTLVNENDLNPVWNREEGIEDYVVGDSISFTIYDQDFVGKHDVLGKVTLKSDRFHPDGFEGELPLEEAGKGINAFLKVKVSAAKQAPAPKPDTASGTMEGGEAPAPKPDTASGTMEGGEAGSPPTSDIGAESSVDPPRNFWDAVVGDMKRHSLAQELGQFNKQASDVFNAMDRDHDGKISRAEFREFEKKAENKDMPADEEDKAHVAEPPLPAPAVSPTSSTAEAAAAAPAPDRFFHGTAPGAPTSPSDAASTSVQVKPGDHIVGEFDRDAIHERSRMRLEKQGGQASKDLVAEARSALASAALDGHLARAFSGSAPEDVVTPPSSKGQRPAEEAEEGPSLARPGAAKVQHLSHLDVPTEAPKVEAAISPASASAVETSVTPLGESVGGLLQLNAADILSPSNMSFTATSSRMSPQMSASPKLHAEEVPGSPLRSPHQRLVKHGTAHRSGSILGHHEVKLYQVRKIRGEVVEREVPVARECLNQGDSFVLDTEDTIYVWHGQRSQPLEKYQATTLAEQILTQRCAVHSAAGKVPQVSMEVDGGFWGPLGGEGPVKGAEEATDAPPSAPVTPSGGKEAASATVEKAKEEAPAASSLEPAPKKKFAGKSPFMSSKEMDRVFAEADTDGNGSLSLEEMLAYLGDYLRYGDAEILAFHTAHGAEGGLSLELLKRHFRQLDPYNPYKLADRLIVRKPGAFGGMKGVDCRLEECRNCSLLICDRPEEVYMDELVNCRVLVAPCTSSTFVRNCKGCDFWIATRQFRVRDCSNCRFYLYTVTEPVIEMSSDLSFAPLSLEYPGFTQHFQDAAFDASKNRWNAIFDFSGRSDGANWRVQPLDECETLVVSFGREPERPDSPCQPVTQELLLAPPLPSEENTGSAVASIPQTRPPPPPAPERRHPISGELLDKPRRRLISDKDDAGREGHEEIAGVAHPWKPLPPFTRAAGQPAPPPETSRSAQSSSDRAGQEGRAAAATVRTGRPQHRSTRGGDGSSSSDSSGEAVRPSPLARGRNMVPAAKAVARGAPQSDSDDDDAPHPKARALLGSAMASRVGQLMRRLGNTDSDEDV